MPAPMMPAPTTPTDLIGFGLTSGFVDAGVFLVAVGEEEDVDQRPIDRRAEQVGQTLGLCSQAASRSPPADAEHQFQRRERGRIMPLVCCWM